MAWTKITPKQFAIQWRHLPSMFDVNVLNFEILAGKAVEEIFKQSFYLKRFNSAGAYPWKPKSKHNKNRNELMVETGNLRSSIKSSTFRERNKHGVNIYSDRNSLKDSNRQFGRNFYYARVHNFGEGGIPQRQFIGYSSLIPAKLMSLSDTIFRGFPK